MKGPFVYFVFFLIITIAQITQAIDYHLVGWTNTFIPGGGQLLLGNYFEGLTQSVIEFGTFSIGYNLSAKSPMTLDGVPEQIPSPHQGLSFIKTTQTCVKYNKGKCIQWRSVNTKVNAPPDSSEQDVTTALNADILQEVGIKYHMVNVFDS